jgi:ESS family glutamate:Na+ symporter
MRLGYHPAMATTQADLPTMQITAWGIILLAVPVLLLGEWILRRVRPLARINIPSPVVGGFFIALIVLAFKLYLMEKLFGFKLDLEAKTAAWWWTWWVTTHAEWRAGVGVNIILPLLVVFYTTLGMCASWNMVKKGGTFLVIYLVSTLLVSVLQNAAGYGAARAMGEHGALGMVCGSVSLMGGFSTAVGFEEKLQEKGFPQAPAVGIAAATFGLVMSNAVSAPLGTLLIRRKKLAVEHDSPLADLPVKKPHGIFYEIGQLAWRRRAFWQMLIVLLLCAKASAYVTYWINLAKIEMPVQVGAMIVGLFARFLLDAARIRFLNVDQVEAIGAVTLSLFLSMAMMTLDLSKLGAVAVPMFVILFLQVLLISAYAFWINFRMMGKDYEAAVTSSGLLGFGLGATPNAIASMKSLTHAFGPAPKAFLIVPVTGAFLSDVINVMVITTFINVMPF